MQTNILWTGVEYYSLENCLVNIGTSGIQIRSTIVGLYEGKIYQVDYRIETNLNWETRNVEIACRHNNRQQSLRLKQEDDGRWTHNDNIIEAFTGCVDVDIPVTPLTNTLPIRRLNLQENETKEIRVIYCDLLAGELSIVQQSYTRRSARAYHYANVPNDFEAAIEVDADGFVIDYPSLFVRTAKLETGYESNYEL